MGSVNLTTNKIEASKLIFTINGIEYNLLNLEEASIFQEKINCMSRIISKCGHVDADNISYHQYTKYYDNGTVFYINKKTGERKFELNVGDEIVSEYDYRREE